MKLKTILTTAVLTTIMAVPAFAFSKIEGKVTDVRETEVTIEVENRNYSISLEDAAILKNKRLIEVDDIKEGDGLIVIYEQQTFTPTIYPPRKMAHTALVSRDEKESEEFQTKEPQVINMLELLPYYARGNKQDLVQTLEDIIDTNYFTGLEVFDDILNF
ncbi:MAG: hypothetical protein FWE02_02565 [Defluviitaleaceae bacterium]|nr:hypothetical protein [Defluviitaleaceae bacterium]